MNKIRNSTIGLLVSALMVDDDARARGFLVDARGQFRGRLQRWGWLPIKSNWGVVRPIRS